MSKRLMLTVDAVRGTTSGEESGAACYTRSRVLAAVRQHERRRVLKITFGIPLVALLMGSAAWAASGQHLTAMVRYVSTAVLQVRSGSNAQTSSKSAKSIPRGSSAKAEQSQTRSELQLLPVEATAREPAPPNAAPESSAQVLTLAQTAAAPSASIAHTQRLAEIAHDDASTARDLLLYESAHNAHFVEKNWTVALTAWERYLRKLPHGRFAVEARYNRALCLLRVGRTEEARRALTPFAEGAFGSYRKREAKSLIKEVEESAH